MLTLSQEDVLPVVLLDTDISKSEKSRWLVYQTRPSAKSIDYGKIREFFACHFVDGTTLFSTDKDEQLACIKAIRDAGVLSPLNLTALRNYRFQGVPYIGSARRFPRFLVELWDNFDNNTDRRRALSGSLRYHLPLAYLFAENGIDRSEEIRFGYDERELKKFVAFLVEFLESDEFFLNPPVPPALREFGLRRPDLPFMAGMSTLQEASMYLVELRSKNWKELTPSLTRLLIKREFVEGKALKSCVELADYCSISLEDFCNSADLQQIGAVLPRYPVESFADQYPEKVREAAKMSVKDKLKGVKSLGLTSDMIFMPGQSVVVKRDEILDPLIRVEGIAEESISVGEFFLRFLPDYEKRLRKLGALIMPLNRKITVSDPDNLPVFCEERNFLGSLSEFLYFYRSDFEFLSRNLLNPRDSQELLLKFSTTVSFGYRNKWKDEIEKSLDTVMEMQLTPGKLLRYTDMTGTDFSSYMVNGRPIADFLEDVEAFSSYWMQFIKGEIDESTIFTKDTARNQQILDKFTKGFRIVSATEVFRLSADELDSSGLLIRYKDTLYTASDFARTTRTDRHARRALLGRRKYILGI